MDQNINLAQCIVKQDGWGETIVTNICSGTSRTLPWQLSDWMATSLLGGIVVLMLLATIFLIAVLRS